MRYSWEYVTSNHLLSCMTSIIMTPWNLVIFFAPPTLSSWPPETWSSGRTQWVLPTGMIHHHFVSPKKQPGLKQLKFNPEQMVFLGVLSGLVHMSVEVCIQLKNMSQIGSFFFQVKVKIKNVWNHQPDIIRKFNCTKLSMEIQRCHTHLRTHAEHFPFPSYPTRYFQFTTQKTFAPFWH